MIYTFGHSTMSWEEATDVLSKGDVTLLVDIRSHPISRFEQWTREQLVNFPIRYVWLPGLGGWTARTFDEAMALQEIGQTDLTEYMMGTFPKHIISRKVKLPEDGSRGSWTVRGFYDYQFVMTLTEFFTDIELLLSWAEEEHLAIMCSESVWWKCHRSMVADYLYFINRRVDHLQPRLSQHDGSDRLERYHPYVLKVWQHNRRRFSRQKRRD